MEELKYIVTCDLCGEKTEAVYVNVWRIIVPVMVTDDTPEGCGSVRVEVQRHDLCPQCQKRVAVVHRTISHDGKCGPLTCSV